MNLIRHGIVTKSTEMLLPHYNGAGRLCTVICDERVYLAGCEPFRVVEESVVYYGGAFAGVVFSAKQALGNIQLPPVLICARQGIYMFSVNGFRNKGTLWLAPAHICRVEKVDKKRVVVTMLSGAKVEVHMGIERIYKRISEWHCLMKINELRTNIELVEIQRDIFFSYDADCEHYRWFDEDEPGR